MAGISPLPPLPIELPAEKPVVFQQMTVFSLDAGILGQGTDFTVSAGRRLVIEQIGAAADLPPGQKLTEYTLSTTVRC